MNPDRLNFDCLSCMISKVICIDVFIREDTELTENLLNGNAEDLHVVQAELQNRDNLYEMLMGIKEQLNNVSNKVKETEKAEAEEISDTLKNRRNLVKAEYEKQLKEVLRQKKKEADKRSREKNMKVEDRVKTETSEMIEKNKECRKNLKKYFKEQKVPSICLRDVFYCMFMPQGTSEIAKAIADFAIFFAVIPFCVGIILRFLLSQDAEITAKTVNALSIIVPTAVLLLFIVIYYLIYVNIKVAHIEALREGRNLKNVIKKNEREIKTTTKNIHKDKDESLYGLENYDENIKQLVITEENIRAEESESLKKFDTETANAIITDIKEKRKTYLDGAKAQMNELAEKAGTVENQLQSLNREISSKYQVYLGEKCERETIDKLISIIENKKAATVSEAIRVYDEEEK